MEDLCTACLSTGRNLYFIGETGFYQLYTQILNEIPVYDLTEVCIRVCWECRYMLHKLHAFKQQVKTCYTELLQYVNQTAQLSKLSLLTERLVPPRLQIQHVSNLSYPGPGVKIKSEPVDELFSTDGVKDEADETHCEPETFVNNLKVEKTRKSRAKPTKGKKTKSKIKTKIKSKRIKQPVSPVSSPDYSDEPRDLTPEHWDERNGELERAEGDAKEAEGEQKNRCNECDLVFETKGELKCHIETDHAEPLPPTTRNGAPPRAGGAKEVLNERPQCVECGKMFSSRKTYRYHLNVLHKGQNRYPCPRCGKVYQWKSNLGRHMRSHRARDSGELYCETCDKRFASVATYRQHLRVSRRHVPESEFTFMCNECGKKFVNKTRLRDHIDWEHLKKIKFQCQLCHKPFKCHTSLYVHMQNVHRNKEKKDNLCHVCGKSYQNAAKLKYHIVAMHTSETPYQCEQCRAAFGWYSSLYRHVREVHYKVKSQPKKGGKKNKKCLEVMGALLPPVHPPGAPVPPSPAP